MIIAEITKDHLDEGDAGYANMDRVGVVWTLDAVMAELAGDWFITDPTDINEVKANFKTKFAQKTKFRLYDDDGNLCYAGWLINDDWAYMQSILLKWGERDVGATVIKIKSENGKWEQEIG